MIKTTLLTLVASTALAAFSTINTTTSNTIRIELTERALDDKFEKTQAIIPVFKYESNTIEEYTLIGDYTKKELGKFTVKMPNMEGTVDTAYSFLFFGASTNQVNKGYVLMVIGNYKRGSRPGLLYIDRNMNLDLTDDGAPDTMNYFDDYKDITLTNPQFTEGTHTIRLSRFPIGKNEKYKILLGDHYRKNSGSKKFTSVNFSFREQRINVIRGSYKNGQDSFSLALKDNNCDGIYNEEETDLLYLSSYKTDVFDGEAMVVKYGGKERTSFEWNGKKYLLSNIDKAGKYVELTIDEDAELVNVLPTCDKVPKFTFVTPENDKYDIKDFKKDKKPIYIYVFNLEDPNFQQDTLALRQLHNKYKDKVTIITLNYGQTPKQVWAHKYFDHIPWIVGLSNANFQQAFFIEETPVGILINHKRRLCKYGLKPSELLSYYDKINP